MKKRGARRKKDPDDDEMRPEYDFSGPDLVRGKYLARYAQGFTITIRGKGRKTIRIVKTAEEAQREIAERLKRQALPGRQPMLVAKSPDPEGERDVCFRDKALDEIAEDSRRARVEPSTPRKSRARRKPAKKRG